MHESRSLNGRVEKRLPMLMVVRLRRSGLPKSEEMAHTDNFSLHGARVVSSTSWLVGEHADIVPVKDGSPMRGEVVYCQSLGSGFFVGFKFEEPVTWAPLIRYQFT